jgi:PIN domain nuclease of toxin-antitoxin system
VKLLLDTHILLWAAGDPDRLSPATRSILLDEANSLFFSSASIWEIVIKRGLKREDFRVNPHRLRKLLVANGYTELPLTSEHALAIDLLPPLHKDPFDRVLIAQARTEGMQLLTADSQVVAYGEGIMTAG